LGSEDGGVELDSAVEVDEGCGEEVAFGF